MGNTYRQKDVYGTKEERSEAKTSNKTTENGRNISRNKM
jgi:hypothetical protein